jgi:leucyl-tRNA synthetase
MSKAKKYDFKKLESRWQKTWEKEGIYQPNLKSSKKPFYNLMMFPYPSAEGLHVGNMYAFTGSDVYGRLKRMQGNDVFEPIGLDGFGIHSENYAIKVGTHPVKQAQISEKRFYKQLQKIGNGFAWNNRLETYNPDYYRWTQWVFIQLWKKGLAYRKKQTVNWCPSCKTVLADEQVEGGKCERCSSEVEQRDLEQWFFRITKYSDRLLKNLDKMDWSEKIKIAQRNWIGKSEGASIKFQIPNSNFEIGEVEVFTTRPDTLFGVTFLVISPELAKNWMKLGWSAGEKVKKYIEKALLTRVKEQDIGQKEKSGEFTGLHAVNPVNGEKIPVWTSDYVLAGYGTGAIMAVPAHDARDFEFAKKYNLPIKEVISGGNPHELWEGEGETINSGKFSGMDSERAKWEITKLANGERKSQFRLRDWLISRQRYWGAPIPMIHCEACAKAGKGEQRGMPGWYAVKESDLPVKLPMVKEFRPQGTGVSPLASVKSFYETKCPHCKGKARRETDVSDTFLDSAWYYLRYPSVKEKKVAWNKDLLKKWFPVNMYIGGAEHSVLHLLYVRFVAMALKDMKFTNFEEPFKTFRAHGLLIKDGAKMSKSKGNVVNPDEYIERFGADSLRTYLMFLAPFEQGGDFRDQSMLGVVRFLERVWKFFDRELPKNPTKNLDLSRLVHQSISKITEDLENLRYNTAISSLMIMLNGFEANINSVSRSEAEIFLKLLAPLAPHITEDIWRSLGNKKSIHISVWPKAEAKFMKVDEVDLVVQVMGKFRGTVKIPFNSSQGAVEQIIKKLPRFEEWFGGKTVKKVIFVPNKIINFVLE